MKDFMYGFRKFADSILSLFGLSDDEEIQSTNQISKTKRKNVDRTVLSAAQRLVVFTEMQKREQNNVGYSRNCDKYITMPAITESLNNQLGMNKSRQFYSTLYRDMKRLNLASIDPFNPTKEK